MPQHTPKVPTAQAWRTEFETCTALAKQHMGTEHHTAVDQAVTLIVTGRMELAADGLTATVLHATGGEPWTLTDSNCPCGSPTWCAHLLGRALLRKVHQRLKSTSGNEAAPVEAPADTGGVIANRASAPDPEREAEESPATQAGIPPEYLVQIHGKTFVRYAGLLWLAHARGLLSLSAELVSVTAEVAIAKATARFSNGSVFSEAADATPGNVNKAVKAHYPRCALTRAKARCLRDALNLDFVALEELE